MNQVSDFTLAKAVSSAGAFPSISIFNYYRPQFRLDLLEIETKSFGNNFLLSLSHRELKNVDILDFIISQRISAVEILEKIEESELNDLQQKINLLRSNGVLVFLKVFTPRIMLEVDGAILKGSEGAGRSKIDAEPLELMFAKIKNKYQELMIIPSGGISSADQVKYYIDHGAAMVAIGTLFAACKESSVSMETKQKIIDSDSNSLTRFDNGQQGLVFDRVADDDFNHTRSLMAGIQSATQGHIFLGRGIDNVKSIASARDIVKALVKNL